MMRWRFFALATVALLACWAPAQAGFVIGLNFGPPCYHRPYYGGYYYYRPYYPVYVAPPPPVFVEQVPVVQPVPVVQQVPVSQPAAVAQPTPTASTAQTTAQGLPLAPVPLTAVAGDDRQVELGRQLQRLSDSDARVRVDACQQLGRLKAARASDPLAATLAGDNSPTVREAAARSLGIIGSPNALPALQRAAQLDVNNDVRHSAQFSIEIIQAR